MKNLLNSKNGDTSSKRVFGVILLICGLIGFFASLDEEITLSLIIAGSSLLGLGVFEKP